MDQRFSRRDMLKGTGASLAMLGLKDAQAAAAPQTPATAASTTQDQTRAQRMQWWHAARFGMFVHFGVYSTIERHEWVMENEAIPIAQYTPHAATFRPKSNCPR